VTAGNSLRAGFVQWWPAIGLCAGLCLLSAGASLLGSPAISRTLTEALIYVVIVIGLSIFVANTGILSFGHTAFMLLGAYASTWQTCCTGLRSIYMPGLPDFLLNSNMPVLPAAILAGLGTSVVAAVLGLALMRVSGVAASIALFALLALVKTTYENWDSWTAGAGSVIGLPLYVSLPVALGWAVATILAAYAFQQSRVGLLLRASREDDVAARAAGSNTYVLRVIALAVSAFFCAIGGVLYVHYLGTISVDVFWLDMTFTTLAMLVIGGSRSLTGAVVGVLAVCALIEELRELQEGFTIGGVTLALPDGMQQVVLALGMVATLLFRPQGLVGRRELRWPFAAGDRAASQMAPDAGEADAVGGLIARSQD
jgi:branched-chain amino acid transport system permease protein